MTRTSRDEAWARRLASEDREGAWDAFLARYRKLILATIGRMVADREEHMDAFAHVCEGLRQSDFKRLRQFDPSGPARFSTWLVTVVRNTVVDWHRRTRGRRRSSEGLAKLSELQRRMYACLADRNMSFVEAYEFLRSDGAFHGKYGDFLRAVRDLYREVESLAGSLARELVGVDPFVELSAESPAPASAAPGYDEIQYERARALLEDFPPDLRLAVLLFVVDDVPAAEVARIVGWPNRKAVYNRVYRALASMRKQLRESDEQSKPHGP